jgi:hypothetical protein
MILPNARDPRFVTIRRGGTLTDADHRLLALWAASCAEHVLGLFESAQPGDPRPRQAIELGAAAYAIKAARAAAPKVLSEAAGRLECQWQRDQLPEAIRELVLDDQRLRNDICWSVFDC